MENEKLKDIIVWLCGKLMDQDKQNGQNDVHLSKQELDTLKQFHERR